MTINHSYRGHFRVLVLMILLIIIWLVIYLYFYIVHSRLHSRILIVIEYFYTVLCTGTFSTSTSATHAHVSPPTWARVSPLSSCSSWMVACSLVMQTSFSAISFMLSFWSRCRQESSLCRCSSRSLLSSTYVGDRAMTEFKCWRFFFLSVA